MAEQWRGLLEFIHGRVSTPHAWRGAREGEQLALVPVPYPLDRHEVMRGLSLAKDRHVPFYKSGVMLS